MIIQLLLALLVALNELGGSHQRRQTVFEPAPGYSVSVDPISKPTPLPLR